MMATTASALHQSTCKDSFVASPQFDAYPSPSQSPATTFLANMQQARRSPSATFDRCRPSVKALLSSANPPASPLDALVMALEATVEEEKRRFGQDRTPTDRTVTEDKPEDEEDDPDATIPSSPTVFMKRPATGPSLHHLPTMMLPESVASSAHLGQSSGLTPSTLPEASSSSRASGQRKLSISSQGSTSSSSTHSGGERMKEYTCTIGNCEKKFYQVAHLRSHERRCHSGTRPYVCRFDGCDRAFTQLGNLKTHERKHTGERPYRCPHPECDKTFTQLGNLKTHERIHDEVKPFVCRLAGCGKTFSQLGNLKTHTTKMHPDVSISDEELGLRAELGAVHMMQDTVIHPSRGARLVPGKEPGAVQVIAHFNPYQRRPIKPQRYEEELLLKKIRAMIQHQQRMQELEDGSEASDDMYD